MLTIFIYSSLINAMQNDSAILQAVIANNKKDFIRITKYINLNAKFDGKTMLHHACINNNKKLVQWLIANGADLNTKCDNFGYTALHYALDAKHFEIFNMLIEAKADVNSVTNAGLSLLHFATALNNKDLMYFLIKKGANLNIRDNNMQTPLAHANAHNKHDIAALLLQYGAQEFSLCDIL